MANATWDTEESYNVLRDVLTLFTIIMPNNNTDLLMSKNTS